MAQVLDQCKIFVNSCSSPSAQLVKRFDLLTKTGICTFRLLRSPLIDIVKSILRLQYVDSQLTEIVQTVEPSLGIID